jgi:hypothetical protein
MKIIRIKNYIKYFLIVLFVLQVMIYVNLEYFDSILTYSLCFLFLGIIALHFHKTYFFILALLLFLLPAFYSFFTIEAPSIFDYTFLVYDYLKDSTRQGTFIDSLANVIFGLPRFLNILIILLLLSKDVRHLYLSEKK